MQWFSWNILALRDYPLENTIANYVEIYENIRWKNLFTVLFVFHNRNEIKCAWRTFQRRKKHQRASKFREALLLSPSSNSFLINLTLKKLNINLIAFYFVSFSALRKVFFLFWNGEFPLVLLAMNSVLYREIGMLNKFDI